jgi:hypothetical protein
MSTRSPRAVRTRGPNPAAVVAMGGMARSTIGRSASATPKTSRTVVNAVLGEGRKHLVADPEIATVCLLAGKDVEAPVLA